MSSSEKRWVDFPLISIYAYGYINLYVYDYIWVYVKVAEKHIIQIDELIVM